MACSNWKGWSVRASSRSRSLEGRGLLTLLLAAALGLSLLSVDWTGGLLHSRGVSSAARIFGSIFTPGLSPKFLGLALEATWKTLTFAVTGVTLAVGIGLPLGIAASGVLFREGWLRTSTAAAARFVLALLRSTNWFGHSGLLWHLGCRRWPRFSHWL